MRSLFLPLGLALAVVCGNMLLALTGCSGGSNLVTGTASSFELQAAIDGPGVPDNAALSSRAIIQPSVTAVAVLKGLAIANSGGAVSVDSGAGLAIKYGGKNAETAGILPLQQAASSVSIDGQASFPAGVSTLSLVGGNISLQEAVRGAKKKKLTVSNVDLTFDTNNGELLTWTAPSQWKTRFTRQGDAFIAKGSYLILSWNGKLSVPPSDGIVIARVTAYYKGSQVWDVTHTGTVVRKGTGGSCSIIGSNQIPFDTIAVEINMANSK